MGVICNSGQPPLSRSVLISPAASAGVKRTSRATCISTMMPPMVSTPQLTVPVTVAYVSPRDNSAQSATSRSSQCKRPNRRQRNSLTITGLVSGPMGRDRRCGSTRNINRRSRRTQRLCSSLILPASRERSKIEWFSRLMAHSE